MINDTAFTVWFTGLPRAGKSTLSRKLYETLKAKFDKIELLDGDDLRSILSADLGFSEQDRMLNITRIGWLCNLLNKHGVICVVAAIAPLRNVRAEVRNKLGNFVEVYVKCPVEICEKRDASGLYKKAKSGKISNFTGISQRYEEPLHSEIVVETHKENVEFCVEKVIRKLNALGLIN